MKVELSNEKVRCIMKVLDDEIKSNDSFIEDLKDDDEKTAWVEENNFLREIKTDLKIELQLVIQQIKNSTDLTPTQEDYMIESQLENIRLKRDEDLY